MLMPTNCPRCRAENAVDVFQAAAGKDCECRSCGTFYDPITECETGRPLPPAAPLVKSSAYLPVKKAS